MIHVPVYMIFKEGVDAEERAARLASMLDGSVIPMPLDKREWVSPKTGEHGHFSEERCSAIEVDDGKLEALELAMDEEPIYIYSY
jgi:hypothetical protein